MKELLLCACVGLFALWVNSTVAPAVQKMVTPAVPRASYLAPFLDKKIDSLEQDTFPEWDMPPMSTYNNR